MGEGCVKEGIREAAVGRGRVGKDERGAGEARLRDVKTATKAPPTRLGPAGRECASGVLSARGGRVDGILRRLDDDETGAVERQLHGFAGAATEERADADIGLDLRGQRR